VDFDCCTQAGQRLFYAEASCITLAVAARVTRLPDSVHPFGGSVGSLAHEVRTRIIRKVPQAERTTDAPVVVVTGTLHRWASWLDERLAIEVVRGTDILTFPVGPDVRPEDQRMTVETDIAPSPFVVWDPVAQRLTWQANAVAGVLLIGYPFTQPSPGDEPVSGSCQLLLHPGAVRGFAGIPLPEVPTYTLRLHGDAGPVEAALLNPEASSQ
jgi:hypothetical protein